MMNNKSQKMDQSISGMQDAIDNGVDRSKYNRIDLDSLTFKDVPLSMEDSLVDIIPIDWYGTESDNKE